MSLSFALSIPKSLFSLDCLSLINLMLNLEAYFSKSPGLEREKTTDEMVSIIYVYHLLFKSLKKSGKKREVVTEIPISLFLSLRCRHNFFGPPFKCQQPHPCLRRPWFKLTWFLLLLLSFFLHTYLNHHLSSVRLCFIKLGAGWGSNRISLPFKLQQQMGCHRLQPSLPSPYFPNSLLGLTLFDYNMARTVEDRNYVCPPRSGFSCTLQAWLVSLLRRDMVATGLRISK